ncbi:MAG: hypothetical protein K6G84_07110 [Lachnospiraceae bacterium]|nr:hypothetical protein [Lachnospiraceae bacterium]
MHTPQLNDVLPMIATSSDDRLYMVANGKKRTGIFLYRIDENGNVENFDTVQRGNLDETQRAIAIKEDEDDNIYFLTSGIDKRSVRSLQIYKADRDIHAIERIAEIYLNLDFYNIADMYITKENAYLSVLGSTSDMGEDANMLLIRVPINKTDDENKDDDYEIVAVTDIVVGDGDFIKDAVFDGKSMYAIDSGDDLWEYSIEEDKFTRIESMGKVTRLEADTDTMIFTTLNSESVVKNKDTGKKSNSFSVVYKNSVTGRETTVTSDSAIVACDTFRDGFVVLKADHVNGFSLEFINGNNRREVSKFTFNDDLIWKKVLARSFRNLILLMLLIALGLVSYRGIWKKKSLAVRVIACVLLMNFLFSSLFTLILLIFNISDKSDSRVRTLTLYRYNIEQRLDNYDIEPIDYGSPAAFLESEMKEFLTDNAESLLIENMDGAYQAFQTDLVYADDDIRYVMHSDYYGVGDSIANAYGREVSQYLDEYMLDPGDLRFYRVDIYGERNSMYIYKLVPEGAKGKDDNIYVFTYTSDADFDIYIQSAIRTCVISEIIYTAVTTIVLIILLYMLLHPIKSLCYYMAVVAGGMYDLPDRIYPDNEIGEMWIYLHALCGALKVRNVARSQVLDYYARFVPRGFERLFSVDELQDINPGSVRNISSAVAVLENGTMATKNGVSNISGYSNYQNKYFSEVSEKAEKYGGISIANDGDMDIVRTMFSSIENRAQRALEFSLDVLNSMEAEFKNSNCIVLLHEGTFSCGIIGDNRQQYPFVLSQEIDFLRQFLPRLKNAGVRAVMTEGMRQKLVYSETFRYIGYVSNARGTRYKLYEDLNPCQREIREAKIRLDDEMQDALVSFYKGDYKDARESFSKIVKELPEDGIAAWYLFRSEELLIGKDEDRRTDLFCKERFTLLEDN